VTSRLDRPTPSSGSGVGMGLEVWLIGTHAELDAAMDALAGAGQLVNTTAREPLTGADRGRYRTYTRTRIPTAAATVTPAATTTDGRSIR
jgi:hypothetical protein